MARCAVLAASAALVGAGALDACTGGSAVCAAAAAGPSLVQLRRTVAKESSARTPQCVHETDCDISAWCRDTSLESWCGLHGDQWSPCPTPHCRLEAVGTPAIKEPVPVPSPAPSPAPSPTTTKATTTTARTTTTTRSTTTTTRSATTTTRSTTTTTRPTTTTKKSTTTTTRTTTTSRSTTTTPRPTTTTAQKEASGPTGSGIGAWFSQADFDAFFPNIDNPACSGANFFSYQALVQAAAHWPTFANSGDVEKDKLELAAFLGQTSHETTGGWATAPGGPFAWGFCFKQEVGCDDGSCTNYCQQGNPCGQFGYDCTCVSGQTYQGRGPIQLSWNYNYGQVSKELFGDASFLMQNPSLVATNATVAYMTGIWFWMKEQPPKPSCHDVMTGAWTPTAQDLAVGRKRGYGMVTNIINGGLECDMPTSGKVEDRVGFYRRYAQLLGVAVDESTMWCDEMEYFVR